MMFNRGMPAGYGGRAGRIMPQPMPPQDELPLDPNAPQMGGGIGDALSGGFKAGGDPNAPQGNAPAIAIPGAGNPPPPGMGAAMGGMAQAGGMDAPMMKPQLDDPMAAQGGAMGAGQAMAGRLGPGTGGMRGMIRQMLLRKMQGGV